MSLLRPAVVLAVLACCAVTAATEVPFVSDRLVVRVAVSDLAEVARAAAVSEPWEVDLDQGYLILDVSPEGTTSSSGSASPSRWSGSSRTA
jgi:hypothetical protein